MSTRFTYLPLSSIAHVVIVSRTYYLAVTCWQPMGMSSRIYSSAVSTTRAGGSPTHHRCSRICWPNNFGSVLDVRSQRPDCREWSMIDSVCASRRQHEYWQRNMKQMNKKNIKKVSPLHRHRHRHLHLRLLRLKVLHMMCRCCLTLCTPRITFHPR